MTTTVNPFRKKRSDAGDLTRALKELVRTHFRLSEDDSIMVAEVECQVPGCPPLETVVAFWCPDGQRRHFKIFKPLVECAEGDLPPWWMKDALIVDEIMGCPCC
jgi:nitrate reductase delta subunit